MCNYDAPLLQRNTAVAIFGSGTHPHKLPMRIRPRKVFATTLALFLFPLAVHAALYASKDRPASFRDADWSSVGMLPPAAPTARRGSSSSPAAPAAGRAFSRSIAGSCSSRRTRPGAVTTWSAGASRCAAMAGRRTGAGSATPARAGRRARDQANVLIPKVKGAIAQYSSTTPATTGSGPGRTATPSRPDRAARGAGAWRPRCRRTRSARIFARAYAGLTDSRTGVEASLLGRARRQARLGRGHRGQLPRPRRRPRRAPSGREAAGLRPPRHRRRHRARGPRCR